MQTVSVWRSSDSTVIVVLAGELYRLCKITTATTLPSRWLVWGSASRETRESLLAWLGVRQVFFGRGWGGGILDLMYRSLELIRWNFSLSLSAFNHQPTGRLSSYFYMLPWLMFWLFGSVFFFIAEGRRIATGLEHSPIFMDGGYCLLFSLTVSLICFCLAMRCGSVCPVPTTLGQTGLEDCCLFVAHGNR